MRMVVFSSLGPLVLTRFKAGSSRRRGSEGGGGGGTGPAGSSAATMGAMRE